jgi:hypothetical protein
VADGFHQSHNAWLVRRKEVKHCVAIGVGKQKIGVVIGVDADAPSNVTLTIPDD